MEETNSVFNQIGAIIVVVLVLGLFLSMGWAIVSARRKHEARKQRLISLGYDPVESPTPELMKRIVQIYQKNPHQKLELQNVFQRSISKGAVANLIKLPKTKMWLDYDSEVDVLYLHFEEKPASTHSEIRDDGIIPIYGGDRTR